MSTLSADRKSPVDYGVQIRFINDLDDTGGGYLERSRNAGGAVGAGGINSSSSSKYGVAVRVQGVSGHPYVFLKDGGNGDSYGVQLKPQAQSPNHGFASPVSTMTQQKNEKSQTPVNPYASPGFASTPEEELVEFGNFTRRPPGDGQAGTQGDAEARPVGRPISAPPLRNFETKDFAGLNEAGLRPVRQTGGAIDVAAAEDQPGEAIDTKSLAPINKLISKFNNDGTASIPSRTRGRSGARARLQFEQRTRSRSLDARKEPEEESPPSPTINPYASIVTPASEPTTYSNLKQSPPSITNVSAVSMATPPTFNEVPKIVIAEEEAPVVSSKSVTPDLLKSQSPWMDMQNGVDGEDKEAIYKILKEGSAESEASLRRKATVIHEKFSGPKQSNLVKNGEDGRGDNNRFNSQLQQQLDLTRRELQQTQDQLMELRMEKDDLESCLHQQEDQVARLQEELKRATKNSDQRDALHTDVVSLQAELTEMLMLKQKVEETLRMRERELTALKGALKEEVATHDRDMEALKEQYSKDMEALQQSMEHVSQSQQEIEEERQKVNVSILALEEELESYREQSEHWEEQEVSLKQERKQHSTLQKLLQAQQQKKELEDKLLSINKQTCETDSHIQNEEVQHCQRDLAAARLKLEEQNEELVKKEAELQSVKSNSENAERDLRAEIDKLKEESEKYKKELETVQLFQEGAATVENDTDLQETNNRLREQITRMSQLSSSQPDGLLDVLEEENRSLKMQLDEERRTVSRLNHEKEELDRQLEEREKERGALRRGRTDLEDEKRLLDRTLGKMNKEIEMMMGDSRHSVLNLQTQLDEFRDRSRRELQDAQRLSKDRLAELQRAQNNLKSAQEEASRLKKDILVCTEERDSAQLDKELLSSRLKMAESELEKERASQADRNRDVRFLEEKLKLLEIELDEEKTGAELLTERVARSRDQMDQLRSELMQERSARHDLEMDRGSYEKQIKELKSRIADLEDHPRSSSGLTLLENKVSELEDLLLSEEREKSSILGAHKRTERKLKEVTATLDQERNQHAEQRDQLLLRVKALKRQVDETEGEVERLEGVRKKMLRDLEEQRETKNSLTSKISSLENELRRKVQQARRPAVGSTLSSEEEDGLFDPSSITSILNESHLPTTSC